MEFGYTTVTTTTRLRKNSPLFFRINWLPFYIWLVVIILRSSYKHTFKMNLPHVSHHRCPVISAQAAQLQELRSVLRELPWWRAYHEKWHVNGKRKEMRERERGPFLHPLRHCLSPPRSLKAPIVYLVMETLLAGYCSVSLRLSLRLVGTLRSNDDHGNENVKKAIGLITTTTIFHLHHAFLYISLPSLHDYDMKMPNFKFYRGSTQATTKFPLSLSELGYGP